MIKPYLTIQPIDSAGSAAKRYVPLVLLNRVLAFARLLIVTRLLGEAGKAEFGLYQPALELINWFVPVVLLGLSDVIERYSASALRAGTLHHVLKTHRRQFLLTIAGLLLLGLSLGPWVASYLLPIAAPSQASIILCVALINVAILAAYQYLLGLLRGIRAYAAAAGMETCAAVLLIGCSAAAAVLGGAVLLLIAYAISNLLPLLFFLRITSRYCSQLPRHSALTTEEPRRSFAYATFTRLMLVMTYGYAVLWAVSWIAGDARDVAEFSAPWRIAQLLAYLAVTMWSSTYGIIVGHWSRGAQRRARAQLTRIGRIGISILLIGGSVLILMTPLWQTLFPAGYQGAIHDYLRVMTAVFMLNGILFYLCMWCDLLERPGLGAALWASVLIIMAIVILEQKADSSPWIVLGGAWAGFGAAIFVFSWGVMSVLRIRCDWLIALLALAANIYLLPAFLGGPIGLTLGGLGLFLAAKSRRHLTRFRV